MLQQFLTLIIIFFALNIEGVFSCCLHRRKPSFRTNTDTTASTLGIILETSAVRNPQENIDKEPEQVVSDSEDEEEGEQNKEKNSDTPNDPDDYGVRSASPSDDSDDDGVMSASSSEDE